MATMREVEAKNLASPEASFSQVKIPEQRVFDGVAFPLVLSVPPPPPPRAAAAVNSRSSCSLADAVRAHKPWIEGRLREAGAVLFRGFPIHTASEFNEVLEAFGYDDAPFMVGGAPRTHVIGRVFTSNDGPSHLKLHFHNEMAYIHDHPSKAFFYCEVEPENQGETPIVLGHVVYQRLKEKHPELVERLEEHGLIYSRILPDGPDPSSILGRGWQSTFATQDKTIAENKAAKLGWKLEWLESGVRVVMGPVPGIKVINNGKAERKTWFNSLLAAHMSWVDSRNKLGSGVKLGDGSPLPQSAVNDCINILDEECVAFRWHQGDVLILDNWAVLHGRRPFTGRRRVLAAFCN